MPAESLTFYDISLCEAELWRSTLTNVGQTLTLRHKPICIRNIRVSAKRPTGRRISPKYACTTGAGFLA